MTTACPSILELEAAAAAHDAAPASILDHVGSCEPCRRKLDDMTANNRFLQQLRPQLSARTTDTPTLGPGVVHGFELLEEISRGGQGVVYRAIQSTTKRPAAVKMLLGGALASDRQQARFHREIEIAARLRHPGIVSVFESGVTIDGRQFVAMEYVEGVPLDIYLRRRWPLETTNGRARNAAILRLIGAVASAAGHAHSAGVIHRDLKPSNILVDASGAPRILDFGLARADDSSRDVSVTREFVGTLGYAAPEQLSGQPGAATSRTDVYALGVLLYTSLTERHPYPCDGPFVDIARQILSTEPAAPSTLVPRLPHDIDTIVLKALAKDPSRRYQNAGALAADIEDHLAGRPISARRDSAIYVLSKLARKHRVPAAAAAVILLTIIGALIGLAVLASDLEQQRTAAVNALSDSAIHRARLLGAAGEIASAERILWTEALGAGLNPDDADAAYSPDPAIRRAAWALTEFYSRLPRVTRIAVSDLAVRFQFDEPSQTFSVLCRNGEKSRLSLDSKLIEIEPSWLGIVPTRRVYATRDLSRLVAWEDQALRVLDTTSRRVIAGPIPETTAVPGLAISDDGGYIALVDEAGSLTLRDGSTAEVIATVAADGVHNGTIGFSSSGEHLLAAVADEGQIEIRVWDIPDRTLRRACQVPMDLLRTTPGAFVRRVAANADATVIAAIVGGVPVIWTDDDANPHPILTTNTSQPETLWLSDRGNVIIITDRQGSILGWRIADFAQVLFVETGMQVTSVELAEAPGLLIGGDTVGRVSVYESELARWMGRSPNFESSVHAADVSADGGQVYWGDDKGALGRGELDPLAGGPPDPLQVRKLGSLAPKLITDLMLIDQDRAMLVASVDGTLTMHDAESGAILHTLLDGDDDLWSVAATPDARIIAASGAQGDIYIFEHGPDAPPSIIRNAHAHRVPRIAMSPDGRLLASAGTDSTVAIWNIADRTLVHRLSQPADENRSLPGHGRFFIRAVEWSPDGKLLVSGGDDRAVRVWNPDSGELVRSIEGLGDAIYDFAFHPSGRILFVAARSADVKVVDPHTGSYIASIGGHERIVFTLRMTSDGRKLITAGEDPWIGVWDLDHMFRYTKGNAQYWRRELE